MRRPGLDEDHVASHEACGIRAATRVRFTVKYHCTIAVFGIAQDLMEENGKSVQVPDVKRAKIRVESVVEEGVIHRKIHGISAS